MDEFGVSYYFKWVAIHKVAAMNDYDKTSHAECFT